MRMDSKKRRKTTASGKVIVLAIAVVLLLSATVTGTLMYLVSKTTAVTNCQKYKQHRRIPSREARYIQSQ